ncbi:ABC-type branched-subunit amino acid transport system substrate-binding protein [Variovorax paradoxus]|uniref:ABC transporter substrate-binding protein n=1 Tax=Variovorax paradoxus TaxID=34073 RepID=UPI0027802316|nr:ABC transporter substrate-binding protein [Variovorax paradoxus]MDP9929898.1 ABC-type branched-subunit amino acid transport system substrate-binding protein [Variovorax paradoxus]MDQ0026383.1 ABC-type branched-subunit amino acid transport system substrate-binding protein [Variovorax paradoxus]
MMNRRHFSVAAGAATLGGFQLARAQGDTPLVLGQSAPFTGPAAQLGIQFHQGAKLFLDQYNAQPGRRQVVIKNLDDGYEPDRCAANTQKLIEEDVFALFGYIGTPTSLAAMPLAVKDKVPFIAPFTGAMSLREPFQKNVFHLRASYNDETALIVKQLTHLHLKKIAVFYQNDAYGKAGLDGVTLALSQQDLKPLALATVERNSVDVAAAVKTIVAAKPDAVVQVGAYKACAAFIRQARKAGYGGTFFNVSFVGTQALADELGKEGAGVMVTQVVPSPYNPANALTREFSDAVKKVGASASANFSSMEGYLAAKVLTEGLRRATGKVTRDSLIAGLESIDRQQFGGFEVSFSAKNHVASKFVELSMITADGRVRT